MNNEILKEMKVAIEKIADKHNLTAEYQGKNTTYEDVMFSPHSEFMFLLTNIQTGDGFIVLLEKEF